MPKKEIEKISLTRETTEHILNSLKEDGEVEIAKIGVISVKSTKRKGYNVYTQKYDTKAKTIILPFFRLHKFAKEWITGVK